MYSISNMMCLPYDPLSGWWGKHEHFICLRKLLPYFLKACCNKLIGKRPTVLLICKREKSTLGENHCDYLLRQHNICTSFSIEKEEMGNVNHFRKMVMIFNGTQWTWRTYCVLWQSLLGLQNRQRFVNNSLRAWNRGQVVFECLDIWTEFSLCLCDKNLVSPN